MLKVDDRFKGWMRNRLKDRDYAERVLKMVSQKEEAVLVDSWLHAALPEGSETKDDPEAMIGMLKGRDGENGKEFIVAFFGKWDDCEDVVFQYVWYIWSMYHPVTDSDFEKLPELIEVAFRDLDREDEMVLLRWMETTDPKEILPGFEKHKINLINTKIDSEMIRIITGKESKQEDAS